MSPFTALALALAVAQAPSQPQIPPPAPPAQAPAWQDVPAGQPASALPVLTIDDALQVAAERNLDLQVLDAQLAQANEISWKAWSGYLPHATVTGAWQAQREITANLGPDVGSVTLQPGSITQGQVQVTQTLLSLQGIYGIRQANAAERAATLNLRNARRSLLFGVAGAYYGAAALKETLGVAERLLEIAQRQEKDARVRFQAGTIAKVGLVRAEIDRARAEQDLKRSRNAYESARLALATLLDRDTRFDVTAPRPPPLGENPNPDELVKLALDLRMDLKAARAQLDAAHAFRSGATSRYVPDVAAFFRYQEQSSPSVFAAGTNWQGGVALSWTLLDGGLRESDVREGNARIREADAAARRAELAVRQEVLQALIDLDSARANTAKAKEQRDLAAENLRLVDVSYRAGAATAVELADATASLRNAEIGALTETLNAQLAALRVLQATGEENVASKR
jgi:outer membrane protein, multidrug efflux system